MIIQVGQCGNQLGNHVLTAMSGHANVFSPYFSVSDKSKLPSANAVLIDMEPKVIGSLLSSSGKFNYSQNFSFFKQEGSGNNWAHGFLGHGPACKGSLTEVLRKCAEREPVSHITLFQAMGGGTGSGVGSFVCRLAREELGVGCLNVMVAPRFCGEVILQFYNSAFSLATCYEEAEGIVLLENDTAHDVCKTSFGLKHVHIEDMNRVLGSSILPILACSSKKSRTSGRTKNPVELIEQMTPLPSMKLLTSKFVPLTQSSMSAFQADSWSSLFSRSSHLMLAGTSEAHPNFSSKLQKKALAIEVSTYSPESLLPSNEKADAAKYYGDMRFFTPRLRKPNLDIFELEKVFDVPRAVGVIANSPEPAGLIEKIRTRAETMALEKAYVYQYEKYGLEGDTMWELFEKLKYIEDLYKGLAA